MEFSGIVCNFKILDEINFGESRSSKIAIFALLGSEICQFGTFQPSKSAKNNNLNSEPLQCV